MRLILIFVLACYASAVLQASTFEDANRLYEQGNFGEAIPLYQNLLKSGHRSPGVLFNLGNAYFKNGELGRAIVHYRRAQKVAPRDPDILANLRFARERVLNSVSIPPSPWDRFLSFLTLNELAAASTGVFWIWIGLLCLLRWQPSFRPALRSYIAAGTILFTVLEITLAAAYFRSRQEIAIVTESQASVRLGPLTESQQAFTVADGTELRVLARREDWLQVEDRSGRTGWLNASQISVMPL